MNVFVRRLGWAAAALSVSFGATIARAQSLPEAKDLIAKYGKAVGGEAWKSHKSARMKATLEMAAQGMRADIEAMNIFATRTFIMKTELPGMGQMIVGLRWLDGLVARPDAGRTAPDGDGGCPGG